MTNNGTFDGDRALLPANVAGKSANHADGERVPTIPSLFTFAYHCALLTISIVGRVVFVLCEYIKAYVFQGFRSTVVVKTCDQRFPVDVALGDPHAV